MPIVLLKSGKTLHAIFTFSLKIFKYFSYAVNTAILIMVVSPAVLAHNVSTCAGDVSMRIAVFPVGWIYSGRFEKLGDGYNASTFDQRSANEREGEIPQAREIKFRHVSNKTLQLTTIMKIAVKILSYGEKTWRIFLGQKQ